jgi:hypothetical protein
MQTIKDYYTDEVLWEILSSIEKPHYHFWRIEYTDGLVRKNNVRITSIKELRDLLFYKGREPSKVFVSVSQFLNADKVFGFYPKKSEWMIANTLFLKSDLLFDFDSEEDLSIALHDAQTVYQFMKGEKDYRLLNIKYSGCAGFHLLYEDINPIIEPHPIKRLKLTQKKREDLVRRLPELRTIDKLHKKIIADQFRVHAVIGSLKAQTGHKVELIEEHKFTNLQSYQAKMVARPTNSLPQSEKRSMTNPPQKIDSTSISGTGRPTISPQGQCVAGSPPPTPAYPYTYNFVTNRIRGVASQMKEYYFVPVLKYNKDRNINIKRIQEKYNLSSFYHFKYSTVNMFVCFKAVSKKRLLKIYRYAKPNNLSAFMYFGHDWIPISDAIDSNGCVVWKLPMLQNVIESPYGLNDQHSRPHSRLLNLKFKHMIGKWQNNINTATVRMEAS